MHAPITRQALRSTRARARIVEAALAMFARDGYAHATMDDVCLAAGLSKGGLYHHFPTKPAVLCAVIDHLAASGELLPPLAQPAPISPRVLIELWAVAARDESIRHRLLARYDESAGQAWAAPDGHLATLIRTGSAVQSLLAECADTRENEPGRAA